MNLRKLLQMFFDTHEAIWEIFMVIIIAVWHMVIEKIQ